MALGGIPHLERLPLSLFGLERGLFLFWMSLSWQARFRAT